MYITEIKCGPPPSATHASHNLPDAPLYGLMTVAEYNCDVGYKKTGGHEELMCHDKNWIGDLIECECK